MRGRTPTRNQIASAAVLVALITGLTGALLGGSGGFVFGATGFVTLTLLALPYPVVIAGQVVAGAALVAGLLLSGAAGPFLVLPLVAGVIAAAELIALAARLGTPRPRAGGHALSRVGVAIVVAGGSFASVLMLGALPGPTGLMGVALASGACVALSFALVGSQARHSQDQTESKKTEWSRE